MTPPIFVILTAIYGFGWGTSKLLTSKLDPSHTYPCLIRVRV